MAQFRAERADKEIARLRNELERSRRDEGGLVVTEIRRAHRQGRREMAEIMKIRRDQFSYEFEELKEGYKASGDYRECRGIVGRMFLTPAANYSYDVENARQTRRMNERAGDFVIPRIEENIWKQWDPIPVSPDTVEAETRVPDETGEVNQPVAPLNVEDYLLGGGDR